MAEVIAGDIPDTGHANPLAMARALVTYIDCPDRVFQAVRAEFGTSPCHKTIRQLRVSHEQPMPASEPFKPHDGYYPDKARKDAAKASALFVARIMAERMDSTFRNTPQGPQREALNSSYLTCPKLVDKAWERTVR